MSGRRRSVAASWMASSGSATGEPRATSTELARVLAQRNALLRAVRAEEAPIDSLAFWDEQLAQVGARVMRARLEVMAELVGRIGPLHDAVAVPSERGDLGLAHLPRRSEGRLARAERARRPAACRRRARCGVPASGSRRSGSARRGTASASSGRSGTTSAPSSDGRDVAAHASRGQQRTIILAMKLAETDLLGVDGPRPVVLLDDVFSELDPGAFRAAVGAHRRPRAGDRHDRRSRHPGVQPAAATRRSGGSVTDAWSAEP